MLAKGGLSLLVHIKTETRKPSGYARLNSTSANNSTDLLSLPMCHVLHSMLRIVPGMLADAPFHLPYIIILMWNKLNLHLPLSLSLSLCVRVCTCVFACISMCLLTLLVTLTPQYSQGSVSA